MFCLCLLSSLEYVEKTGLSHSAIQHKWSWKMLRPRIRGLATRRPVLKSSDDQLGLSSFPQEPVFNTQSSCPLLSLEILYDVVLIFKTSTPKSCYQGSLFNELLRKCKARNKNINLLASTSKSLKGEFSWSWPSVHFLLDFPISSVTLFVFSKVARKSPGNTPPASWLGSQDHGFPHLR